VDGMAPNLAIYRRIPIDQADRTLRETSRRRLRDGEGVDLTRHDAPCSQPEADAKKRVTSASS
jgi:hypothetical protein